MSEIIRIEGLTFRYARGTVPALSDIDLSVQAGEFIGITGPAGAGKTTLLSCVNGVIPHYYAGDRTGSVTVDGLEVGASSFRELASHIGSVFEDPDFQMVSITVEEEIAFGPENLGIPPSEIEQRIQDALEKTGIVSLRERAISTLSGGQKQRVAISAALGMRPKVLLLDDPTSELDPVGTAEVIAALRELNHRLGITVLMVSQDMEQLVENADRILVLSEGHLILDGPPREICAHAETLAGIGIRVPQVTQFMISLLARLNCPPPRERLPLTVAEAAGMFQEILHQSAVR